MSDMSDIIDLKRRREDEGEEKDKHEAQRLKMESSVSSPLIAPWNKLLGVVIGSGDTNKGFINMLLPYLSTKDSVRLTTISKRMNDLVMSEDKRTTFHSGDTGHYIHISHWVQIAIHCPGMLHLFKKVWYEHTQLVEEGLMGLGGVKLFMETLFPLFAKYVEYLYLPTREYVQFNPNQFSLTRLIATSDTKIKDISIGSFTSWVGTDRVKHLRWENENQSGVHRIPMNNNEGRRDRRKPFHFQYKTFMDFPLPLQSLSIVLRFADLIEADPHNVNEISHVQHLTHFLFSYLQSPSCKTLRIQFYVEIEESKKPDHLNIDPVALGHLKSICQHIHDSETLRELFFDVCIDRVYTSMLDLISNDSDMNASESNESISSFDFLVSLCAIIETALNNKYLTYLQTVLPFPGMLLPLLRNQDSELKELHVVFRPGKILGVDPSAFQLSKTMQNCLYAVAVHPHLRVLNIETSRELFVELLIPSRIPLSFPRIATLKISHYSMYLVSYDLPDIIDTFPFRDHETLWASFLERFPCLSYLEIKTDMYIQRSDSRPLYTSMLRQILSSFVISTLLPILKKNPSCDIAIHVPSACYIDSGQHENNFPIEKILITELHSVFRDVQNTNVHEVVFVLPDVHMNRVVNTIQKQDIFSKQETVSMLNSQWIRERFPDLSKKVKFSMSRREMHQAPFFISTVFYPRNNIDTYSKEIVEALIDLCRPPLQKSSKTEKKIHFTSSEFVSDALLKESMILKPTIYYFEAIIYEGQEIGWIFFDKNDRVEIINMFISKPFRNKNYGTRFIKEFIQRFTGRDIVVKVPYEGKNAIQMFIKAGMNVCRYFFRENTHSVVELTTPATSTINYSYVSDRIKAHNSPNSVN